MRGHRPVSCVHMVMLGGDRVLERTFTQAIAEIAADNRSGATQIAERAADILLQRASVGQAPSAEAFRREILITGWALIHAQTVMAPLVNLVNTVMWRMEQGDSPGVLHQAVAQATDEFKRQLHQHSLHVAEGTLGLIDEGSKIVTLSFSSTIQHALMHAQRAGRRIEVASGGSCDTFGWPFRWPAPRSRVRAAYVDDSGRLSPLSAPQRLR